MKNLNNYFTSPDGLGLNAEASEILRSAHYKSEKIAKHMGVRVVAVTATILASFFVWILSLLPRDSRLESWVFVITLMIVAVVLVSVFFYMIVFVETVDLVDESIFLGGVSVAEIKAECSRREEENEQLELQAIALMQHQEKVDRYVEWNSRVQVKAEDLSKVFEDSI